VSPCREPWSPPPSPPEPWWRRVRPVRYLDALVSLLALILGAHAVIQGDGYGVLVCALCAGLCATDALLGALADVRGAP
jgi:hypothetical protein